MISERWQMELTAEEEGERVLMSMREKRKARARPLGWEEEDQPEVGSGGVGDSAGSWRCWSRKSKGSEAGSRRERGGRAHCEKMRRRRRSGGVDDGPKM
jgi:hypothetical protein